MKIFSFFILVIWIYCFCLPNTISAQDHKYIDSLIHQLSTTKDTSKAKTYFNLALAYDYYKQDSLCFYAQKMNDVAQNLQKTRFYALSYTLLGYCHSSVSQYDSSLYYYNKVYEIYKDGSDKKQLARAINNISASYYNQGKIEEAMEYTLQSIRINEAQEVRGELLGANYWNLGNLEYELNNLNESNAWYQKAIEEYAIDNKLDHIADIKTLIAKNYKNLDSLDLAIRLFKETEKYQRENNHQTELATVLDDLGMTYMLKEEWGLAEEVLLEALPLAEQSLEQRMAGYIYQRLTMLYTDTNRPTKAIKYAELSLKNSTELALFDKKSIDYEYLALAHELAGNNSLALTNYKKFTQLKDSINLADQKSRMQELKVQYETEKKQQEIKLLEEKAKRNSIERKGLIGGIILLLSLFTALTYAMQQRIRKNKLAKEKANQALLFSKKELEFNQKELELKRKELTAYTLQLAQKNKILEDIKKNITSARVEKENHRSLQKVINTIDINQNDDENWEGFKKRFLEVHVDFESNVIKSYPKVSSNELRLMALLKMNLSSKEIANILNISLEGIKKARYRLRKKLGLETGASLEELVLML